MAESIMKEFIKRLWKGVNGLSAVDFSETGVSFMSELHKGTQEKPEKDVDVHGSTPIHKSQSTSDSSEFKS